MHGSEHCTGDHRLFRIRIVIIVVPLHKGWDPIGEDISLLVNGGIFLQFLQPACTHNTGTHPVLRGMAYRLSVVRSTVWSVGPCAMQWSHCTLISPRQSQDGAAGFEDQVSFQNPTILFCHL